jgi:hypothetical protein
MLRGSGPATGTEVPELSSAQPGRHVKTTSETDLGSFTRILLSRNAKPKACAPFSSWRRRSIVRGGATCRQGGFRDAG